jgi:hypothetical protein
MPDALIVDALTLLRRRMAALNDPEMRLRDWDLAFVGDICFRKPEQLTDRQVATVELLCWRYREQILALPDHPFPGLVPSKEPKIPAKPERRWSDTRPPFNDRRRGPR